MYKVSRLLILSGILSATENSLKRAAQKKDTKIILKCSKSKNYILRIKSVPFLLELAPLDNSARARIVEMYKNDLNGIRLEIAKAIEKTQPGNIVITNLKQEIFRLTKIVSPKDTNTKTRSYSYLPFHREKPSDRLNRKHKEQNRLPYGG